MNFSNAHLANLITTYSPSGWYLSKVPYFPHSISSNVNPAANIAETRAIGKPVALDANAEEREVLGLISITAILSETGSWANCTFVPPITPTDSTILNAWSFKRSWTSWDIVNIGALQKESPVWTPNGSIFSIKQTVIMFPFASLTISTSNSSHPKIDSSIKHWWTKLACKPRETTVFNSSTL